MGERAPSESSIVGKSQHESMFIQEFQRETNLGSLSMLTSRLSSAEALLNKRVQSFQQEEN